jgi:hypothetical protein
MLRINQEMINIYLNFIMRVNLRINQEMIMKQLNIIMNVISEINDSCEGSRL